MRMRLLVVLGDLSLAKFADIATSAIMASIIADTVGILDSGLN